ncbi:hypothetical protein F5884DRAFT_782123 [Xylogone sp. PMI_703]|nr:hypothetical protein F5884DRAFT_782123 [Xylogone sp. PMI_703]
MPPLILHNVPDEELYVGEDGIRRPYAMVFPSADGNPNVSRARRAVPETGSFGKSTRRSRSRTGTPAVAKREDPTIAAADAIFSSYLSRPATPSEAPQRRASVSSVAQPNISTSGPVVPTENSVGSNSRYVHKEPTEVILSGFKSSYQYAAIKQYEQIAGRICEDYPRDPPVEQRRYKADLRDPAALRRRALTPEERSKALRFAGGEHWIKITFESAEAAEAAIFASPQMILGYLVSAELYRGVPPASDVAVPANSKDATTARGLSIAQTVGPSSSGQSLADRRPTPTFPRSFGTPAMSQIGRGQTSMSPPESNISSRTFDTATLSTTSTSSGTVLGNQPQPVHEEEPPSLYCRKIPTAKRIQLLPAEQALLPQQSYTRRLISNIPLINWFSADMIGDQVPRTETGEFDRSRASLYWRIMWWIDSYLGILGIYGDDKDD